MSYITEVDILDESKDCFLTYAEEVLTDRSIPAAEDGLLSSQRKILWTMEDYLKMDSAGKTKKCNAIVGSTLATSYFHGDQACYGVLCKMSQKYLMRYPLLVGQGSLGTQENNDIVASSRYTEAKPSIYTDLMMNDYKKGPVPTKETYNGEFMEPVVLPSLFPNALCNGRQAIGISMSHTSAPMCLNEVCDGIIAYINNENITIDELMNYIKGPDFPLGNVVINSKDIKTAFATGKSNVSLKIRGDYEIKGDDIIFNTIPYRTYRNKIKEQLEKNIEEFENIIEDFDDESTTGNNKLVFHVKKGISHKLVLNKLFKYTDLQSSLSYNMNYIVNGTPKLCSIKDLIQAYVNHQNNIIIKIANFDKEKAEARKHIIEGLIIALNDIDKAIEIIKNSNDRKEAKEKLMNYFSIDDIQADAILDMKLSRLTKLDKDDLLNELNEKIKIINECNKLINDKEYRNNNLSKKILNMKEKYGDERRTKLLDIPEEKDKEEKEIEFVEPEKCVVMMTEAGTIKRVPSNSYKAQHKGGKGIKSTEEIISSIIRTNTIDSLMIFSNKGKMYRLLVNDIPEGTSSSKGTPIKALISMEIDESPAVIYSIYHNTDAKFVLFVTKNGIVKKTTLDEFAGTKKKNGIGAITLKDNDELATVTLIKDEPLIIISNNGYVIKFDSLEVGATSRMTAGVKGITLDNGDYVVSALPLRDKDDYLALFSSTGIGKKIKQADILSQKRGGKGLCCYKISASNGNIIAGQLVNDKDSILIVGNKNSLCINATEIPLLSRIAIGNTLIQGGRIMSVTKI